MSAPRSLEVFGVRWPEVQPGADLSALVSETVPLQNGDVLLLTSKVVSKAEGRVVLGQRSAAISAETRRIVAERGEGVIAQTRHGLVLAAAGVDESNTEPGTVALLPEHPDGSARQLREDIQARLKHNVAVIVTDTAGRAWRMGQTDMAIGCAGISPLLDLRGTRDSFGQLLEVTTPAVADELAAAGDLVKGKTSGCPVAVVRGLEHLVLPVGDHGPGAAALIRNAGSDLFALGAREAATAAALRSDPTALERFPVLVASDIAPFAQVTSDDPSVAVSVSTQDATGAVANLPSWLVQIDVRERVGPHPWLLAGRLLERTCVIGAAFHLVGTPAAQQAAVRQGWQIVVCTLWSVA